MRIVGEVDHPVYKISILHHMGKFTLKFESDATEQSYKIRESDTIRTADDIKQLVNHDFLRKVDKVFLDLGDNLIGIIKASEGENGAIEMVDDII